MDANRILTGLSEWRAADAGTGALTATKAAVALRRHLITGLTISADAAPSSALTVELKSASTTLRKFYIPAAQFSPVVVNFVFPIQGGINEAITLTCTAGGAANVIAEFVGFTVRDG